jgi:hypothetical protein
MAIAKNPYRFPRKPPAISTAKVPSVIGTGWIGMVICEQTAVTAANRAQSTCIRIEEFWFIITPPVVYGYIIKSEGLFVNCLFVKVDIEVTDG